MRTAQAKEKTLAHEHVLLVSMYLFIVFCLSCNEAFFRCDVRRFRAEFWSVLVQVNDMLCLAGITSGWPRDPALVVLLQKVPPSTGVRDCFFV